MTKLAWQSLPKDGTKGDDGGPYVVVWVDDPEKVIPTLGRWLSSLDAGVRPNLGVGRRLDLDWEEMPRGPQTLIYKTGMLASLPDGHSPLCCTCLKLS